MLYTELDSLNSEQLSFSCFGPSCRSIDLANIFTSILKLLHSDCMYLKNLLEWSVSKTYGKFSIEHFGRLLSLTVLYKHFKNRCTNHLF